MDGVIVIGEGEKDEVSLMYSYIRQGYARACKILEVLYLEASSSDLHSHMVCRRPCFTGERSNTSMEATINPRWPLSRLSVLVNNQQQMTLMLLKNSA